MIHSGTPKNIILGTKDESLTTPPIEPGNKAQFKPKFYIMAEKGPLTPQEVNGGVARAMYGDATFDKSSKYYKHSTVFLDAILSAPANCIVERVFDTTGAVLANSTLWLDIVIDDIPENERNSDGSVALDVNKDPIPTGNTIEGYKIKTYTSSIDTITNGEVGLSGYKEVSSQGFMTGKTGALSTMYPIMTFVSQMYGETYNGDGVTIIPLIGDNANQAILDEAKVFGYGLRKFITVNGVKKVDNTTIGDPQVTFCFKEGVLDPTTQVSLELEEIMPQQFQNLNDPENPFKMSAIGEPIVYYSNIDIITQLMFAKEAPFVNDTLVTWYDTLDASTSEWFDFQTDDTSALAGQEMLINFLTGESSKDVPYFSIVKKEGNVTLTGGLSEINITPQVTMFLGSGSDSVSHSDAAYEALVVSKFAEFEDRDAMVNSMALNPESLFVDSGFSVDTKLEMAKVLTHRADLVPAFSTYVVNVDNTTPTLGEETAIANLIDNRVGVIPESVEFGTPHARSIIVAGSGIKSDGSNRNRYPLLLDVMVKAAKKMGAGDGNWKGEFDYSRAPRNIVTELTDVVPSFVSPSAGSILWKADVIWAQPKDRSTLFYPSFQGTYDNETSVLNSYDTLCAISTVVKTHEDTWETFSGGTDLTDAAFIEAVKVYLDEELNRDRFSGGVYIENVVTITDSDKIRGYSYTINSIVYNGVMKTVQVSQITAKRGE